MFRILVRTPTVPLLLVVVMVLVEVTGDLFSLDLVPYGVYPRQWSGIKGIFLYPFIHSGWKHLLNNSTALLILGGMLYYFYRPMATRSLLWIYLISGVWLWIGGRPSYHVGASGIVYGLFGFLFFSGVLRRHMKLMALSLLVIFLYGSLVWGVLPIDRHISYEGHLFGLLAGIAVAFIYRKQGPQPPKYSWELEEEQVPDWYPDPERTRREQAEKQLKEQQKKRHPSSVQVKVKYVFKANEKKE